MPLLLHLSKGDLNSLVKTLQASLSLKAERQFQILKVSLGTILQIHSKPKILQEILVKFYLQICRLKIETKTVISFLYNLQSSYCRFYLELGCLNHFVDTPRQIYPQPTVSSLWHSSLLSMDSHIPNSIYLLPSPTSL